MATHTVVPLNTMLADLDESLRALLKRELARHGFDGVEIAFEAPAKEWSAALSAPAVNAFLYDLRESKDHRPVEWEREQAARAAREYRPPLIVEASFALTAWARAVEDEHRLLSQVLAVLYAYPTLPDDVLTGTLRDAASQRHPLTTKVGQPRGEGKSDFWSSVGGQYKPSLDYVVSLACEPGTTLERGPEVRTQTVRVRDTAGAPANVIETAPCRRHRHRRRYTRRQRVDRAPGAGAVDGERGRRPFPLRPRRPRHLPLPCAHPRGRRGRGRVDGPGPGRQPHARRRQTRRAPSALSSPATPLRRPFDASRERRLDDHPSRGAVLYLRRARAPRARGCTSVQASLRSVMPTYLTPGVYVEEVPSQSKPIEGVGTSIAAFVGLAPGGPVNTPMRISNWTQFARLFGDPREPENGPFMEGAYLAHSVYGFFQNGGGLCLDRARRRRATARPPRRRHCRPPRTRASRRSARSRSTAPRVGRSSWS